MGGGEMSKAGGIIKTTVILTLICAVATAALAGTNLLTKDRIAEQAEKNERSAMNEVLPAETYNGVDRDGNGSVDYYRALNNDGLAGFIFTVSESGYGGKVKVMVGIGTNGHISAVKVLDASTETPGLGQKWLEKSRWQQFSERLGKQSLTKDGGEIEAVTGATITSKAVLKAVNKAVETYEEITAEEVS